MEFRPSWLEEFVEAACECFHAFDELSPIGCHFNKVDGIWEVAVFISSTEVVGGEDCGKTISCPFVLDVARLIHLFDEIETVSWQPYPIDEFDDLKNHVAVVGIYQSQKIWFRVLAAAPDGIEPGRILGMNPNGPIDLWGR